MLTAGELGGTALARTPTWVLVEAARVRQPLSHVYVEARARGLAHRAEGSDVSAQPAARVFIFHFRGGSSQSSSAAVVQTAGTARLTRKAPKSRVYLRCGRTLSDWLDQIGARVTDVLQMCFQGLLLLSFCRPVTSDRAVSRGHVITMSDLQVLPGDFG